ncbi:hypothetical protein [Piscinibacter sp.]|uniref:hypothetical protein n=1 Tax=Piscinibacter sp. TaxID=1903157 RepID=UPI002F409CD3
MKVTKANGLNSISIWPNVEVKKSSPLGTAMSVVVPVTPKLGRCAASYSWFASPLFVRHPADKEYEAAPAAKLRLGAGTMSSVFKSGELFSTLVSGQIEIEFKAVCFGDFHLGQQMKVTRPPGRDPARYPKQKA